MGVLLKVFNDQQNGYIKEGIHGILDIYKEHK